MVLGLKKLFAFLLLFLFANHAQAIINIIAAENVYGSVAKEIGGANVKVISILNNPFQDPHLFNVSPSTIKLAAATDIIIYNGADYDPWIHALLSVNPAKQKHIIVIADLMGIKSGDNPHIWYDPKTMPRFAQELTKTLSTLDPQHKSDYENQLTNFNRNYQIIFNTVDDLQKRYRNTPVAATEPLFNYMARSIDLIMFGKDLQISNMNDLPPPISQIKQFEDVLTQHRVAVLIYNSQVVNPMTKRMLVIAQQENIPVIGMSEMMPIEVTYIGWMQTNLTNLANALEKGKRVKK